MRNTLSMGQGVLIKSFTALALVFGLAIVAGPQADAAVDFELGSYIVSGLTSDPGLLIQTQQLLSQPSNFSLSVGGSSHTVDLFRIWTDEAVINVDDLIPQNISVLFDFSQPSFGGSSQGATTGSAAFWILGTSGAGSVSWTNPLLLNFGPNSDGVLSITLSNENFNAGSGLFNYSFPLTPGYAHGATVKATFALLQDPSAAAPPGADAPEASSIAIWSFLVCAVSMVAIYQRRATTLCRR